MSEALIPLTGGGRRPDGLFAVLRRLYGASDGFRGLVDIGLLGGLATAGYLLYQAQQAPPPTPPTSYSPPAAAAQSAANAAASAQNQQAAQHLQTAALAGDAEAQIRLGEAYQWGSYGPPDRREAERWYRMAAEQGSTQGARRLADLLLGDQPTPAQAKEALDWLARAAEAGDGQAAFDLGGYYRTGLYVDEDWERAAEWYKLGSDFGHTQSRTNLGMMYWRGDGVPADARTAARYLGASARDGDEMAQAEYGWLLYSGEGVAQNRTAGFAWILLAAEAGEDRAVKIIESLRAQTGAFDRTAAERLAAAWSPGEDIVYDGDPGDDVEAVLAVAAEKIDAGEYDAARTLLSPLYREGEGVAGYYLGLIEAYMAPKGERPQAALDYFLGAAAKGDAYGLYGAGVMFLEPFYGTPDPRQAEHYLTWAFREGVHIAGYELGGLAEAGDLQSGSSMAAALDFYRQAAEADSEDAILRLAEIYRHGVDGEVAPDMLLAHRYYSEAAAFSPAAQYELGYLQYYGLGYAADPAAALANFRAAADAGVADAQYMLGQLHEDGAAGLTADAARALSFYRMAAGQEHALALARLGYLYAEGVVVARDAPAAVDFLQRAATAGDAGGAYYLATMLMNGNGVPPDPPRAIALLRQAAAQDHIPALITLGEALVDGRGAPADPQAGVAHIARAQQLGDPEGFARLGYYTFMGIGVEEDRVRALGLMLAAERLGEDAVSLILPTFRTGLTAGELAAAETLAADLLAEKGVQW